MIRRYTKQLLYKEIDKFRAYSDITNYECGIDMFSFCKDGGITAESAPFATQGLQGVLVVFEQSGFIVVNSVKTMCEQNFYCGHELMHFLLHRNCGINTFQCYDEIKTEQDSYLEWNANEGAAELLVPYREFIPDVLDRFNPDSPNPYLSFIREELAEKYMVSERVIFNRIDNLGYEIWQVHQGVSIENIELASMTQQKARGITFTSINQLGFNYEYADFACEF